MAGFVESVLSAGRREDSRARREGSCEVVNVARVVKGVLGEDMELGLECGWGMGGWRVRPRD